MPRPRRDSAPNSMVASAARVDSRSGSVPKKGTESWQTECWRFLDTVGELRFAAQWVSNAMSRVRLVLMWRDPETGEEVVVDDDTAAPLADEARAALGNLCDGEAGQTQMLASFGTHLTVTGETWLVGIPTTTTGPDGTQIPDGIPDVWEVLSNDEINLTAGEWRINRGDDETHVYKDGTGSDQPAEAIVIRIWRPHPRMKVEADSPVRASLPILRELEGLTKHVGAAIDSRLAGAGLLLVPSEMTFQTPPTDGAPSTEMTADDLMGNLTLAMTTAIHDRGSASAVAPIIAKAPGQWLSAVQHITFDSPLSEQAMELRSESIRRLGLSMDMPPEVLLGQSDSNHWSAWLISEDSIKVHIEPLAQVLTHALTTEYLWAILDPADTPGPQAKAYRIAADTSALRLRPEKTQQAQALHALDVISDDALRRENGFGDQDKPADDELTRRRLARVAMGAPGPDLVAGALQALGVQITPVPSVGGNPPGTTAPIPVAPSTPPPAIEAPRTPPDPGNADKAATLRASAELMVLRAVERANNRAHRRGKNQRAIPPDQLDACLQGAWIHAPIVAAGHGVDCDRLVSACDGYTRGLLLAGVEHQPHVLGSMLDGLLDDGVLAGG